MCEKDTDRLMMNKYEKYFGVKYHTEKNQTLFNSLTPDGWDIVYNNDGTETLIIIENKANIKQHQAAREQIINYANIAIINNPKLSIIICINGFGVDELIINVHLYVNQRLTPTDLTLKDLSQLYKHKKSNEQKQVNENLQSLHNLIVSETKLSDMRSLSIISAFLILTARLPTIQNLLMIDNNSLMFNVLINEFHKFYGSDDVMKGYFQNNQQLLNLNIIKIIKFIIDKSIDLESMYKQFCKYTRDIQDINIELTPSHISDIMKHYLHKYNYDVVIDPFCGTGSLIIDEEPRIEKIGLEIVKFMYLMTKVNSVLRNVHNMNLINGDSHEMISEVLKGYKENNKKVVCITNPPYTKRISGYYAIECLTWLIDYVDVIIAIIPKSNVSNRGVYNKYKEMFLSHGYYPKIVVDVGYCFQNVNETAVIIVIERQSMNDGLNGFQLMKLDLIPNIDYIKPPRKQKQMLESGLKKIENVKNCVDGIIVEKYDAQSDWVDCVIENENDKNICLLKQELLILMKQDMMKKIEKIMNECMNDDERFYEENVSWCDDVMNERDAVNDLMGRIKFVRFGDVFEFVSTKKIVVSDETIKIPLFGASVENNPRKEVNYYEFEIKNEEPIYSINSTGDGACGYCFIMNEFKRFAISSRMLFKRCKKVSQIDATMSARVMSLWIHNVLKYSHKKGITKARFPDEIVPIVCL